VALAKARKIFKIPTTITTVETECFSGYTYLEAARCVSRAFAQLGSHFAIGKWGELAPDDENTLDLQLGFVDLTIRDGIIHGLVVRAGRQELSCGSSRLVGVRESPDLRRSLDGLRLLYQQNGYTLDAFATRPVRVRVFDDTNERDEAFWGVYAVGPPLPRYGA
jgi:hypothetical protein